MKKSFILLGSPVANSLSPAIYHSFAEQYNLSLDYQTIDTAGSILKSLLQGLKNSGTSGINVTAPNKLEIADYIDELRPNAQIAGAVNCIINREGRLIGENTDGIGLVRDLQRLNIPITDQKILILGAGGAARGIIPELLKYNPAKIYLMNRDQYKALALAKQYDLDLNIDKNCAINLVLNATSCLVHKHALLPEIQKINIKPAIFYDLNYDRAKKMEQMMQPQLSKYYAGFGMLIEQAAEAFYLWFGKRPNTSILHKDLPTIFG